MKPSTKVTLSYARLVDSYKDEIDALKAERDRLLRDIGLIGAMCGRYDAPKESHAILRQILVVVKEALAPSPNAGEKS